MYELGAANARALCEQDEAAEQQDALRAEMVQANNVLKDAQQQRKELAGVVESERREVMRISAELRWHLP